MITQGNMTVIVLESLCIYRWIEQFLYLSPSVEIMLRHYKYTFDQYDTIIIISDCITRLLLLHIIAEK